MNNKVQKIKYKPIKHYLALSWSYLVCPSEDPIEPFTLRVIELPGCKTHGRTPQEAFSNVNDAIESYILSLMEANEPVPQPLDVSQYKGQLSFRTSPQMHYRIAKSAQLEGKSIRRFIEEAVDLN